MSTEITKEAALAALGLKESSTPVISGIPEEYAKKLSAVYEALILSDAIRNGWTPDYDKGDLKWEPWFYANTPGFRFSDSDFTIAITDSVLGPLLCQETEEKSDQLAKKLAEIFAPIYKSQKEK